MKSSIFIFLLGISSATLVGQNNDVWTSFYNKDSTLVGFKDSNGIVKIEPKFTTTTTAVYFDGIIAVTEEKNEKWLSYYLTKSGRIIGKDSLYTFDNGCDCENEGYIRFIDSKKDQTGLFNKNGDVVIPANYSTLSKVKNGMIVAHKNATKIRDKSGEHWWWEGGQKMLIDTKNNILIANFSTENDLNFHSLQKTKTKSTDANRASFKGVDGDYYSFIDYKKEFEQWLTHDLLVNLTKEKLIKASNDSISYWEEQNGWIKTNREQYCTDHFEVVKNGLLETLKSKSDHFISSGGLNSFLFEGVDFKKYYNNCNEALDWKYPTMTVLISHKNKNDLAQNQFEFLRTESGYQLISVSLRN